MITQFKPYPTYKSSGIEWQGKVPAHWEITRLKSTVCGCINGTWGNDTNGQDDLVCVRVADFDRLHLRIGLNQKTMRAIPQSERNRRLLNKGDLLLEKSGGGILQPVGAVMLYTHGNLAVCSNFVARMPVAVPHCSEYLVYLHSSLYAIRLNVRSIKQTTGIQNLDSNSYLSERVAIPPADEQTAIVRFLDYATQRIDRYIRTKERLISLLEEQKQVVIYQAVSGQIDVRNGEPYSAYKYSGVEWLREVPVHWVVSTLRRRLRSYDGIKIGPFGSQLKLEMMSPCGYKVYGQANVISRDFGRGTKFVDEEKFKELSACSVVEGDLLVTMMGTSGRCALVPKGAASGIMDSHLLRLRADGSVDTVFSSLLIDKAPYVQQQISVAGKGSIMHGLNSTIVKDLIVAIPPLPEQTAIARFLDKSSSKIDNSIACAQRQIDLLHEYRTRLISDVVTGKLDIREAATRLPQEVDKPVSTSNSYDLTGREEYVDTESSINQTSP